MPGLADYIGPDHGYRITLEESWHHERPQVRRPDCHWYEVITCRGGAIIGLYSESPPILHLITSRPGNARHIWEEIKDSPGCSADFRFDGEAVLYFPPDVLPTVADRAGARRKRKGKPLSPEGKARLIEAGRAYRFGKDTGLQIQKSTLPGPILQDECMGPG